MLQPNYKKAIDSLARTGRLNKQYELFFNLTYKCPLRCTYCYVDYNRAEPMTQEQIDYAIEKLCVKAKNTDIKLITFFGGEPALEIKLIEDTLSKWYDHPEMKNTHFGIITSFSVHQDRLYALMKKYPLLELVISYDVDMNQRPFANKKTFQLLDVSKKKHNIDLEELSKINRNMIFAKTITGDEIDLFSDLMWLKENFDKYQINYALQLSKTPKNVDPRKIESAFTQYMKLILDKFIETNGQEYVPQFIHQYLKRYWKIGADAAVSGCGLGAEYFIDSKGTISPCSISHHQTDLMVTHEGKYLDNNEHFQELEENYWNNPTCQACPYKGFCPGGCMVHRWMEHRDYNKPNQGWCLVMEGLNKAYDNYLASLDEAQLGKLKALSVLDYAAYFKYCHDRSDHIDLIERHSKVNQNNAHLYARDNLQQN